MLFHEHTHVLAATCCNMSQLEVSQDSEDLTSQPAGQGSFQVITVNMVTSSNTLPFTFGKFGKLHLVHYNLLPKQTHLDHDRHHPVEQEGNGGIQGKTRNIYIMLPELSAHVHPLI